MVGLVSLEKFLSAKVPGVAVWGRPATCPTTERRARHGNALNNRLRRCHNEALGAGERRSAYRSGWERFSWVSLARRSEIAVASRCLTPCSDQRRPDSGDGFARGALAVSYTHLTLPTIYSV